MSYQVLARKWRPKNFEQVVGQEPVVQALVNGLDNDRVHHAFILTGTRGVGKTTIARILAKCLNCEKGVSSTPCNECSACLEVDEGRFQDMIEIDAASKTGVDDMRELLDTVQFAPSRGRYKVYIIDEVHMLSKSSFNALLKTLEEPPPHVKFVLATTDPQKIPMTILSRALRFNLRRLLPDQIMGQLGHLLAQESIDSEPAALERISRAADGSMRDGLSLLDQAIAFGGGKLVDSDVATMLGSVDHEYIARLINALAELDGAAILAIVQELAAQSRDFESVLAELAEVLHRIGLVQFVPGYSDPERADWPSIEELAGSISAEDVQLFYQIAIQGQRDLGLAPNPRTGLEMTLLRMLAFRPAQAGSGPAGGSTVQGETAEPVTAADKSVQHATASAAAQDSMAEGQSSPVPDDVTAARVVSPVPEAAPGKPDQNPDWRNLLERLKLNGAVRELARNIELDSRNGSHWSFVIPDDVKYLGSERLVLELQSEMTAQLGQPVQVALNPVKTAVTTPAAADEQTQIRQIGDAERAIEEDPTIQSLKERFGARILNDSIQPLQ